MVARNSSGEPKEYLEVEADEFSGQAYSSPVVPLVADQNINEADANKQMKSRGYIENTDEQAAQMFSFSRSTSTPHQLNVQFAYLTLFSSTFKTFKGEGVPLEYKSGWQGEIQYLYRFSSFFLELQFFGLNKNIKGLGRLIPII